MAAEKTVALVTGANRVKMTLIGADEPISAVLFIRERTTHVSNAKSYTGLLLKELERCAPRERGSRNPNGPIM
jgi:hypothetical protein